MMTLGSRSEEFMTKVTPDTGYKFAQHTEAAFTRDYPTLTEINSVYGKGTADSWLAAQIADVALFTGAKNLDKYQQRQTARIIVSEYHYLKITELLVFFHWFKCGRYGHFFGSVDPMVITCALREFIRERNDRLAVYEQEERERREAEYRKKNPPTTREEWERIKAEREQTPENRV